MNQNISRIKLEEHSEYYNKPILPNPINNIDFRLEESIERSSTILTKLKNEHNESFGYNLGKIEDCADYEPPDKRK